MTAVAGGPRATVRLQLHAGFGFAEAAACVPYYAALGISHYYLSPILQARRGSSHGYDVTAPGAIDAERGGEAAFEHLVSTLHAHRMGVIVDIVPNHMSASLENAWWCDVLARGRASAYADFFAIDWDAPDPALRGRVLAPFLADEPLVLAAEGRLALAFEEGRFVVRADDARYPFREDIVAELVATALPRTAEATYAFHDDGGRLADALAQPAPAAALAADLAALNADSAHLALWLARQHYCLASWREASERNNWRRFFDIGELVALRCEREAVFDAVHERVFDLYARGAIDGLRIDHVDGLADPAAYLARVRTRLDDLAAQRPADALPGPGWLLVEKILAPSEELPGWPIDGSTGYEFMDACAALLHAPEAPALDAQWRALGGGDYDDIALAARREVLRDAFAPDFARVLRWTAASLGMDDAVLSPALAALLIHYPRYRGYAQAGDDAAEAAALAQARAGANAEGLASAALDRLTAFYAREGADAAAVRAIAAFEQLSSALAARALEDTAFYRYARLISRNEVGAAPHMLSLAPAQFHAQASERARRWPRTLLATATHDHKRGEDARLRIASLADDEALAAALAALLPDGARGIDAPDAIDRAFLMQSIVGVWPDGGTTRCDDAIVERLVEWQRKAERESKRHGGWTDPDETYEARAQRRLRAWLADPEVCARIAALVARVERPAAVRGLAQVALRCLTPGVPDLYQGCEFWDRSLADPDNRRDVDYAARIDALAAGASDDELLAGWRDGRVKQRLLATLLGLRARHPDVFAGVYEPLALHDVPDGAFVAFARRAAAASIVVVVPRLPAGILDASDGMNVDARVLARASVDTGIAGTGRCAFTGSAVAGGRVALASIMARWPLAVVVYTEENR